MVAALVLVAISLGLSNLAAAIGLGTGGVDRRTRLRLGVIFGLFEAAMPVIGLLIGHGLARSFGRAADWLAAALLILVGCASIVAAFRAKTHARVKPRPPSQAIPGIPRLLISGFALSLDNLAAGFALGSYQSGRAGRRRGIRRRERRDVAGRAGVRSEDRQPGWRGRPGDRRRARRGRRSRHRLGALG
ncbi:MAG TPA: manganese efflux pump [Streptosporangiaceae bacterium]|nr:manganese efflux pump [Streptosporangiaceae bacterium]